MASSTTIGPYTVVREIARGGMGAVYHARSPEGRDVAMHHQGGLP